MPKIRSLKLQGLLTELFQKYGAPMDEAEEVSQHLVESNLQGHDSHGVMRAPWYMDKIENEELVPAAPIEILNESAATAVINGNWGFGQPIARHAMELAIKKAEHTMVASVAVRNCNHIGRLGAYTSMAPKHGMIALGTANLHGTSHVVAPHGGIDRKLPTNPISVATPWDNDQDFLLDMASCTVAEGKLKMHLNKGEDVPEGCITDHHGQPTQNPKDFYDDPRGAIRPLGGVSAHKGFGLALAIDVLSGALSGARCSNPHSDHHGNACWFVVLKVEAFTPMSEFKEKVQELSDHVKSSRKQEKGGRIYMPGEVESERVANNPDLEVDVDEVTWQTLQEKATAKEIDWNEFVTESDESVVSAQ